MSADWVRLKRRLLVTRPVPQTHFQAVVYCSRTDSSLARCDTDLLERIDDVANRIKAFDRSALASVNLQRTLLVGFGTSRTANSEPMWEPSEG